jgi:ABC-type nitrate/sulfonate/bicarbonate transport system ATPase subunit
LIKFLEVKNISKYFKAEAGAKKLILDNLNFSITEEYPVSSILTPFGGGKTTLLRILSGLDNDYTGEILLKGKKFNQKLPFIPEKPASFPWLNVSGNIKLILAMQHNNDELSHIHLQEIINLVGLTGYEDHFPDNKSYGFRFRISLARALAASPDIILLDDPLKQMDFETKNEISALIKTIAAEQNIKFIIASSNITEAASLSDLIIILYGNPINLDSQIVVNKSENKIDQLRNQIQAIMLKENILNSSGFSI